MDRDLLYLPKEAFFEDEHPYSLILSVAKYEDYKDLWYATSARHSSLNWNFFHFSNFSCSTEEFLKNQLLTVNIQTGKYMWRRPYTNIYP